MLRLPLDFRVVLPVALRAMVTVVTEQVAVLLHLVAHVALVELGLRQLGVRLLLELGRVRHLHAVAVSAELVDHMACAAVIDLVHCDQMETFGLLLGLGLGLFGLFGLSGLLGFLAQDRLARRPSILAVASFA